MTRILSGGDKDLDLAAEALREGRLVGIPTETVYGLAAKALDESAVAKIFDAKERPLFDPLILHLPPEWAEDLLDRPIVDRASLSESAQGAVGRLVEAFWPGPLTLVLPKTRIVPDLVTSGLDTVAVRIPNHPVTQRLLSRLGFPLAAPSANRFGRISPTSAGDVIEELGGRIDYVIDGGECEIGLESTVIRIAAHGQIELLRPGRIEEGEIESVSGLSVVEAGEGPTGKPQHSPGRLENHYAPSKPLVLLRGTPDEKVALLFGLERPGVLFFSDVSARACLEAAGATDPSALASSSRVLSATGDPIVAARNLFRMLRELDGSEASIIAAELPPEATGISHAIRDRLGRAAS